MVSVDLLEEFPEQETRDPQLDKNLRELGPVKVEQTMTKMRTVSIIDESVLSETSCFLTIHRVRSYAAYHA